MRRLFLAALACFLLAAPWALAQEPGGPESGPDLGDLSRLAEKGDYEATYELALRCYLGSEEERDPARAYGLARPLAEGGDPFFQFLVGDMFATGEGVGQDHVEAARWLALSAGQGQPEAQYGLGLLYEEGRGVGQDLSQALRLYRLSAEQGYPEALFRLGDMYENGQGVARDSAEAEKWFRLAEEGGS